MFALKRHITFNSGLLCGGVDKIWTPSPWTTLMDWSMDHLFGLVHGPPLWTGPWTTPSGPPYFFPNFSILPLSASLIFISILIYYYFHYTLCRIRDGGGAGRSPKVHLRPVIRNIDKLCIRLDRKRIYRILRFYLDI